jgi:hypothetical protein
MGLRIDLPTAGLLGITNATAYQISTTTSLSKNAIYILEGGVDFAITLPSTELNAGDEVVLKKIGSAVVTINTDTIEGSSQSITITNNQPIRCLYVNSTFGWVIT